MRRSNACKKRNPALIEQEMLSALVSQKEKYEKYLGEKQGEDIDHKAEHAYTHIIKTIIELSRKLEQPKEDDPEEMKRIAEEILESEYGIKR